MSNILEVSSLVHIRGINKTGIVKKKSGQNWSVKLISGKVKQFPEKDLIVLN